MICKRRRRVVHSDQLFFDFDRIERISAIVDSLDDPLIRRAKDGDKFALADLFTLTAKHVTKYSGIRFPTAEEREDFAVESAADLIAKGIVGGRFSGTLENWEAWCRMSSFNKARMWFRARAGAQRSFEHRARFIDSEAVAVATVIDMDAGLECWR